jgi:hypothetical protein
MLLKSQIFLMAHAFLITVGLPCGINPNPHNREAKTAIKKEEENNAVLGSRFLKIKKPHQISQKMFNFRDFVAIVQCKYRLVSYVNLQYEIYWILAVLAEYCTVEIIMTQTFVIIEGLSRGTSLSTR